MHILNVLRYAPDFGGGIVKHLAALGRITTAKGYKLTIAYGNQRHWQDELKTNSDIIIIPEIENPLWSGFPKKLKEICKTLKIDVLHFHFYFALPFSLAMLLHSWKLPTIYHWHNPPRALIAHLTPVKTLKGKLIRFFSGVVARFTDRRVITKHVSMSREISELLIKNDWTVKDKILFLPNAVDVPSISRINKLNKNIVPVIGSVSNFRPQKDHETLIRAFKILFDWGINSELWLVGDGPTRPFIERLTRELGIDSKVRFIGTVLNPSEMYSQFDVFALSSNYEGHPLVVLEAMSYGLPIVATKISSIPETVIDGVNGLLVKPKDPEDLALALKKLLTDQSLSKRLGEAGRNTIEEQPSLEDWAERIVELYEHIVKGE